MPVHFGHGGVDFLQLHVELLVLRHEQLYLLLEVEYPLTTCCTSSAIGGFQLLKIAMRLELQFEHGIGFDEYFQPEAA